LSKDIYDIANEINNELSEQHDGDELYHEARELIEENGYRLRKENILELYPDNSNQDFQLEQEHAEIISEYRDENSVYRLRLILSYGSEKIEDENRAEIVGTLEDFTDLSELLEPQE